MVTCPFCLASGVKSSKEHWLPRTWGEYFPRAPGLISANHDYDGHSTERIENLSPFDKQFGGICRSCNSGWLREIDVAAEHTAIELAVTSRNAVSPWEIAPLATSLYRAVLMGMWGSRELHGMPSGRMSEFHATRLPPDDVQILLAKTVEPFLFAGGHYSAVTVDGYASTAVRSYAFGTLGSLFVMAVVPERGLGRAARRVARVARARSGQSLVRVWPSERNTVRLPGPRIDRASAAACGELGVVLDLREPAVGPDPRHAENPRFAPGGSARQELREPTKFLRGAEEPFEEWAVQWGLDGEREIAISMQRPTRC